MPTITADLAAIDFAQIDAALTKVRTALDVSAELTVEGLDPTALLGGLGTIVKTVQDLHVEPDAIGGLGRAALDALGDLVELPDLGDLQGLVDGVEALSERVGRLVATVVGGDDGTTLIDRLFAEAGGIGLADLLGDLTTRLADVLAVEIPDDLRDPLRALERLGSGAPLPAPELAGILATLFIGLDLTALQSLAGATTGAVDVVLRAGDTGPLEAFMVDANARIDAAFSLMGLASGLDVDALVAAIDAIGEALDALAGVELPRFVGGLTADLRTAGNALADANIAAALDGLLAALPKPREEIAQLVLHPLRELADFLEAMTPDMLEAAFQQARERLTGFLGEGSLADLFTGIDEGFAFISAELHDLPVRRLRDTLIDALVDIEHEILRFGGFAFLDDLLAPVEQLAASIREFDPSVVTDAAAGLVATINGAFTDFPIADLHDAVSAVVDPLGSIIDELTPLVAQVTAELDHLVQQLHQIDFHAAGAATVDLLGGIRTRVQDAVGGGDVPEPVKVVIAGAATVLRAMDLAAELTTPFEAAVVRIDVSALIQPLQDVFSAAGAALESATPAALIAELDPPFDQLLARLDALSLEPLVGQLRDLFGALLAAVQQADPRRLVEPLDAEFQRLVGSARAALDPAPILQPLRDAFAALRGLLGQLDAEGLINEVVGGLAAVPGGLTDTLGQHLSAKAGGAAVLPEVGDEPFRFGDILRPLAMLVGELRSRLLRLASDAVGPALAQLAGVTRSLRAVLDEQTGLAVQIADAIDGRLRWADPRAAVGPLADLRARLEALRGTVAQLEVSVTARARLDAASGSIQFDTRVQLDASVGDGLGAQTTRLHETAGSTELGRSARALVRALDDIVPPALLGGTSDPLAGVEAFLDAVFEPIDPMPVVLELDQIGARIMARLADFVDELTAGLAGIWDAIFSGLEPLLPSSIAARLQQGIDRVLAELDVLDPGAIEDEVRRVADAAISLLSLHSPAALAGRLAVVFDAALDEVRQFDPGALLAGLDPFASVRAQLEPLRPSLVLGPLVDSTKDLAAALEAITDVDLSFVGELVADIQLSFTEVLEGVEREWNALLDELGTLGGGVGVSVSIG